MSGRMGRAITRTMAAVAVLAIGCSGSDDDGGGEPAAAASQEVFAVGQTAHTDDYDVTVDAVQDPAPAELGTAQPGNRLVAISLTVVHTGTEEEILQHIDALLTDSTDRSFHPTTADGSAWVDGIDALAGDPPSQWGKIPMGGMRQGAAVFDVPADAQRLQLRVKGSQSATGSLFAVS